MNYNTGIGNILENTYRDPGDPDWPKVLDIKEDSTYKKYLTVSGVLLIILIILLIVFVIMNNSTAQIIVGTLAGIDLLVCAFFIYKTYW